jgi:hypothetical protein
MQAGQANQTSGVTLKKASPEAIALLMKNMKHKDTSSKKKIWMPNGAQSEGEGKVNKK